MRSVKRASSRTTYSEGRVKWKALNGAKKENKVDILSKQPPGPTVHSSESDVLGSTLTYCEGDPMAILTVDQIPSIPSLKERVRLPKKQDRMREYGLRTHNSPGSRDTGAGLEAETEAMVMVMATAANPVAAAVCERIVADCYLVNDADLKWIRDASSYKEADVSAIVSAIVIGDPEDPTASSVWRSSTTTIHQRVVDQRCLASS